VYLVDLGVHMKLIKLRNFALAAAVIFPLAACQIEREQAGSLPDVDVDVEPGSLPEYSIEGPDVQVGLTERTVTVPKVVLVQEQETIQVPYIDVDVPGAERTERTVTAEVEVPSSGYDLDIQEIHSVNDQIWVVSRLVEETADAPVVDMRVSDRVVLNAPDVPVRHYVIGDRPEGNFNEQYTFIEDRNQISDRLAQGRLLYTLNASILMNLLG